MRKFKIFATALFLTAISVFSYNESYPELKIPKLNGKVKLDGRLSEPVWKMAAKIPHLTQKEPVENSKETEHTEVYVFYTDDYLYVGVKCFDKEAYKITAFSLKRDFDVHNYDHIMILNDPFNDRRNGYVFSVNPNGAKFDGLIVNNSERVYGTCQESCVWRKNIQLKTSKTGTCIKHLRPPVLM